MAGNLFDEYWVPLVPREAGASADAAERFVMRAGAAEGAELRVAQACDPLGEAFEVDGLRARADVAAGAALRADAPAMTLDNCRAAPTNGSHQGAGPSPHAGETYHRWRDS